MKRYPNLDLLRLCLALQVVAWHSGVFPTVRLPAVACFVCLSGWLIPTSFGSSRNWGHFAWKRLLRVGPAFCISLVLTGALWGLSGVGSMLLSYVSVAFLGAFVCKNIPVWSLALEEILYAVHACSRVLRLWSKRNVWLGLGITYGLWLYLDLAHPRMGTQILPWSWWFLPICAFLGGNLLNLYDEYAQKVSGWVAAPLSIVLFVAMWQFPQTSAFWQPLAVLFCVSLVLAAVRVRQIEHKLPDLTYGIYIYHYPILATVITFAPWLKFGHTLLFVIPLCLLSWYLVESRALRLKNFHLGDRRRLPASIDVNPNFVNASVVAD